MHRHAKSADMTISANIYQQYLLIKLTTLLFCMECLETQVASLSLTNLCKFSA